MRIFISWSGDTSKQVAQALAEWLPDVLQHVRPFMSAADLQPGTRWGPELARELDQIDFGVCCMTPDNLQRPWIMFEAGALSKRVASARVVPYLFRVGLPNLEGPLTQFQSVAADKEGTYRLVDSIHAAMQSPPLPAERLAKSFERWWPELEGRLAAISELPATPAPPEPDDKAMLKELLLTVRNMQRTWTTGRSPGIQAYMQSLVKKHPQLFQNSPFKVGQRVRIQSGDLTGLFGEITRVEDGEVFIKSDQLQNNETRIKVSELDLELVE